jgi:hypothetical protein
MHATLYREYSEIERYLFKAAVLFNSIVGEQREHRFSSLFFLQKRILVAFYSDRLGLSSTFSHGLASAALLYCRLIKATIGDPLL